MLKIKFTNAKEIEYQKAIETEEFFNGASRRTLTVECDPTAISVDELNIALSNTENLQSITLKNIDTAGEITAENIYDGYILKLELGIKNTLQSPETQDNAATYCDKLVFKLGKKTYIEQQLSRLGL